MLQSRVGVLTLFAALLAAGFAAATGQADPAATVVPTSTGATTATSTATTAVPPTTTDVTTEPASTTTPTTSTPTGSTQTAGETSAAPPTATPARVRITPSLGGGCLLVGGLGLLSRGRLPRVIGPMVDAPGRALRGGGLTYPADGSIAQAGSVVLQASGCRRHASGSGSVTARSLTLFLGVIKAKSVTLVIRNGKLARASRIEGLTIDGKTVTVRPRRRLPIENWGYLVALARPSPQGADFEDGALAVHLLEPHGGLPAGAVLLVSFARLSPISPAATRARAANRRRQRAHALQLGEPLKQTPPLGLRHYIFPVAGSSEYIDTYGAFRSDVPGNWHHGDDIFASLGTPVVAVASGTLNRVGWERLGGWRVWVRDGAGDEFYYAHLSGYSPLALHSKRVRAGDVIGFVGNSGDAFTTSPHVHFEIHPRSLLRLGYNGAVDPTTYLNHWRHVVPSALPRPVHPPYPPGRVRQEARFIWRELLAARHLIRHSSPERARPRIAVPGTDRNAARAFPHSIAAAANAAAATNTKPRRALPWLLALLLALLGPASLLTVIRIVRRKQNQTGSVH